MAESCQKRTPICSHFQETMIDQSRAYYRTIFKLQLLIVHLCFDLMTGVLHWKPQTFLILPWIFSARFWISGPPTRKLSAQILPMPRLQATHPHASSLSRSFVRPLTTMVFSIATSHPSHIPSNTTGLDSISGKVTKSPDKTGYWRQKWRQGGWRDDCSIKKWNYVRDSSPDS